MEVTGRLTADPALVADEGESCPAFTTVREVDGLAMRSLVAIRVAAVERLVDEDTGWALRYDEDDFTVLPAVDLLLAMALLGP